MVKWQAAVAFIFLSLPVFAAEPSAPAPVPAQPLSITRVTPEGNDVPPGRQIVIAFSRPVVPLGRMERSAAELPITLTPAVDCEWRWLNTSTLSCNLGEKTALAYATRYHIEVKPGIKAEDGATTAEPYNAEFITQRPGVGYKQFHLWKSPGLPVIRVIFNQSVSKESVEQHMYMLATGAEHHFFRPATDAHMSLKVSPDPDDRVLPEFLPVPGEKYLAVIKTEPQKPDEDKRTVHGAEARRIWLVEPYSEIPLDTHVVLKVEPGLISALGPEPGVADGSVVEFDTFPQFEFLGLKCINNNDQEVMVQPGASPADKCDPLQSVVLQFNTPMDRTTLGPALHATPSIKGWKSGNAEEEDESGGDAAPAPGAPLDYDHLFFELKHSHERGHVYDVWLPGGLKAAQEYHLESWRKTMGVFARAWNWVTSLFHSGTPIEAADMFGRKLATSLDVGFSTDHRRPNMLLEHHAAVLEKGVDSDVPLFVDNINKLLFSYRRVTANEVAPDLHTDQALPVVKDIQFAMPLGVRSMLGGASGAMFGHLDTEPGVLRTDEYARRLFVQVTPYQVHLKLGHFSSIAWVTDLATGKEVEGAQVTLYKDAFSTLSAPQKPDAQAVTDAEGVATLPGTQTLDPDLSMAKDYNSSEGETRFFLRVQKGADMALMPLSSDFMINSYRSSGNDYIYPSNKKLYGHMRAWGLTAQGIYRAGDTMQYKIYVRNQDNDRFVPPVLKGYRLKILDSMGKKVQDIKHVTLTETGSYSGEYTIPKQAAVGWYTFQLSNHFSNDPEDSKDEADEAAADAQTADAQNADAPAEDQPEDNDPAGGKWVPMRVLVSDFTPAAFKVSGQLNGDRFIAGQQVDSTTHAELHSGGPYTKASARITALLQSMPFSSKHPLAKDFQFDSYENEQSSQEVFQKIDMLDDKGELAQHFSIGKPNIVYGKLMVESAVQDDRGKYISGSANADYVGVDRLVGLRETQWLNTAGKPANIEYIVVDERGQPVAGTDVSIAVEHEVSKAARVKSAGNAYLTQYSTSWESAGECKGVSAASANTCSFTPKEAGTYRATASIKDTKGNAHSTKLGMYAMGRDFVVWGDESDTSLTIIPERTDYKIGDKARYLVKNPYPGAKALITIERYGVLDRFVQTFDGSTPIVEFPIKPDYLPGFYLSVTVMSPRVDKPIEGQVDLGKPAFRMGYITVPVKDIYKEMLVTAKADKGVYKPRDKVVVHLHAEPRRKDKDEPVEITLAVLDESVFDLVAAGKDAFDPYKGFYKLESLDLRNYSLLLRLVGRQKFEKKGANPGGDGGSDTAMRSLFKFVSYWNPGIKADKDGNATVTFDAPDNLTGWRILAMAATPSDRFGLGEANFKVNRPTELRAVMPNQVTEGDSFKAGFSVMNRTDKAREVTVTISAQGNVKTAGEHVEKVKLPPYQRTTVYMPIEVAPVPVQREIEEGKITFTAKAGDATDSDGVVHSLPVHKQRSLEVAANYATTTEDHAQDSIQFPPHILPDVGSVSVVLSPSVIGGVSGAFKYLRDYPYLCWEQQLTKGVMAAHFKQLHDYLPPSLTWKDSEGLPQQTLDNASSFQAPNGGMTYFIAQDQYVDPYLSAYTAIAFNWLRTDGYKVSEPVEKKLHAYLKNLLSNDAMPDFYSEGMSSTVRAVALAALAERKEITHEDIERYAPHMEKMSLFGKAYFLQAALAVGGSEKAVNDTVQKLFAASNETGGKFIFSETLDDGYLRILASPLRDNCAVLDGFSRYAATPEGKDIAKDIPFKLVRTITQTRKGRDYWENTQENMFCMNALINYSRAYESVKPAMTVTASMDDKPFGTASFKSVRDGLVTLERPIEREDVGRKSAVEIERKGEGRLYYSTRLTYALPPEETKPENAGIEAHREYSVERGGKWELLGNPMEIKRGELVRVDLYLSVPVARNFVVVDDPVPGGLEPVNHELATASKVDAAKGDFAASGGSFWFHFSDWQEYGISRWSFYHQELRDHAARFYSDYLPAGNYHLSYTAQAIASGSFTVMPMLGAEMYDPDVFGKTQTLTLHIGEP